MVSSSEVRLWKPKVKALRQKQPKSYGRHELRFSVEDSRNASSIISNHTWYGNKGETYTITFGRGQRSTCLRTDANDFVGGTQTFNVSYDDSNQFLWWGVKHAFFLDLAEVLEDDSKLSWYPGEDWSKRFSPKFVWRRFDSNEGPNLWPNARKTTAVTPRKRLEDLSLSKEEVGDRSIEVQEQDCQEVSYSQGDTDSPAQWLQVHPDLRSSLGLQSFDDCNCADENSTRANSELSDFKISGCVHSESQQNWLCSGPEPEDMPRTKLATHMRTEPCTYGDAFLQFQ
eukprot:TRINITY_DN65939_c0_g1_i1.p1 TRINITY_DN65939_c0_g1~~TRINITY_DN65939_c0_g1_i1.p1  ORF type:complete len:285 (-),score=37.09 TRINITY_DN65939_c0_g1_i1:154-1008(-)